MNQFVSLVHEVPGKQALTVWANQPTVASLSTSACMLAVAWFGVHAGVEEMQVWSGWIPKSPKAPAHADPAAALLLVV